MKATKSLDSSTQANARGHLRFFAGPAAAVLLLAACQSGPEKAVPAEPGRAAETPAETTARTPAGPAHEDYPVPKITEPEDMPPQARTPERKKVPLSSGTSGADREAGEHRHSSYEYHELWRYNYLYPNAHGSISGGAPQDRYHRHTGRLDNYLNQRRDVLNGRPAEDGGTGGYRYEGSSLSDRLKLGRTYRERREIERRY